jgi:hypothetical protein
MNTYTNTCEQQEQLPEHVAHTEAGNTVRRMLSEPPYNAQLAAVVQQAPVLFQLVHGPQRNSRHRTPPDTHGDGNTTVELDAFDVPARHILAAGILQRWQERQVERTALRHFAPAANKVPASTPSSTTNVASRSPQLAITVERLTQTLLTGAECQGSVHIDQAIEPLLIPGAWSEWETIWLINCLTPRCAIQGSKQVSVDYCAVMMAQAWRRANTLQAANKLYDDIMSDKSAHRLTQLSADFVHAVLKESATAFAIHAESLGLMQVVPLGDALSVDSTATHCGHEHQKNRVLDAPSFAFESVLLRRSQSGMCEAHEFADWVERIVFEQQVYVTCRLLYRERLSKGTNTPLQLYHIVESLQNDAGVVGYAQELVLPAMLTNNDRVIDRLVDELTQGNPMVPRQQQVSSCLSENTPSCGTNTTRLITAHEVTEDEFCEAAAMVIIEEVQATELVVCVAIAQAFAKAESTNSMGQVQTKRRGRNKQLVVPLVQGNLLESVRGSNGAQSPKAEEQLGRNTFVDVETFLRSKRYAGLLTQKEFGGVVWRRCADVKGEGGVGQDVGQVAGDGGSSARSPLATSARGRRDRQSPTNVDSKNSARGKRLTPFRCSVEELIDSFVKTYRMQRQVWADELGVVRRKRR